MTRVKDALSAAREHFNIWYIYTNHRDRLKYVDVMNYYLDFFRASISAQFTAVLLTLLKALDKNTRNNRVSIYSLIESAEEHNFVESTKLQDIRAKLGETNEIYEKLQILRNNQFAHLGAWNSDKAFSRAGISLNDLKGLIDQAIDAFKSVSYAYDRDDRISTHSSTDDTYSLLNDLLSMHTSHVLS